MGKTYVGVNGVAKEVEKIYVGVNNVAKQVQKVYVGDSNNVARLVYEYSTTPTGVYFIQENQFVNGGMTASLYPAYSTYTPKLPTTEIRGTLNLRSFDIAGNNQSLSGVFYTSYDVTAYSYLNIQIRYNYSVKSMVQLFISDSVSQSSTVSKGLVITDVSFQTDYVTRQLDIQDIQGSKYFGIRLIKRSDVASFNAIVPNLWLS